MEAVASTKTPDLDRVIVAIIQVESSGGLYLIRHEPTYRWLYRPEEIAKELGIPVAVEVAQQRFSYGPMQVMAATARELGFRGRDCKDLEGLDGLIYGIKYLEKCVARYPKYPDYVAAYNGGSVRKLSNGKYVNQQYVDKVDKHV